MVQVTIVVTILILIDGFLQSDLKQAKNKSVMVTILILIDGFLQYCPLSSKKKENGCHNPYFNRWFSAINKIIGIYDTDILSQSLF